MDRPATSATRSSTFAEHSNSDPARMIMTHFRPALATACLGVLLLSGCSAAAATSPSATPDAQGPRSQQTRMNGTYGLIAAISGTTLQVQGSSGQTAVSYSDSTTVTEQKAGTVADLVVGACATVRSDQPTGASAGGPSSAAPASDPSAVAAASITVAPSEDGQCSAMGGATGGRGGPVGGQGGMPSGEPRARDGATPPAEPSAGQGGGARPSAAPSRGSGAPGGGAPGAGAGGGGAGGGMVTGIIESVGEGTVTVKASRPGSDEAQTTTVTYTDSVAVTVTVDATASALQVGRCALATGKPDDTGAVPATAIRVSDAVDGACTMR